jgi:hypothetical protein
VNFKTMADQARERVETLWFNPAAAEARLPLMGVM